MERDKIVARWLQEEAEKNGFKTYKYIGGVLDIKNSCIEQTAGAVYGIWLSQNDFELVDNIKNSICFRNKSFVPFYWGKDISLGTRIGAHYKSKNKTTGALNLSGNSKYQNTTFLYGYVIVEKYTEFEEYLHKHYPPVEQSQNKGKGTKIRKLLN